MLGDNASHRVFKISELSRAIASHLIPISPESTVNLARTCRYLEEPVLSALWEEQSWVVVLLKVLPEGSLDHKYIESSSGWEVCGWDLPPQAPNAQVSRFSTGSWGIRRQRLGTGSGVTRPGCIESVWTKGASLGKTPSANSASTHPLEGGSQRCGISVGSSRQPISLTSTYSFHRTWFMFGSTLRGHGATPDSPSIFCRLSPQPSPRYRHPLFIHYRYALCLEPVLTTRPGRISRTRSPPPFCVVGHRS